uniref:Uncharacterized protein n=1 Tax=viral metagenome TaxID=1070528 RepID=A0A6C0I3L9_9ZZZZ
MQKGPYTFDEIWDMKDMLLKDKTLEVAYKKKVSILSEYYPGEFYLGNLIQIDEKYGSCLIFKNVNTGLTYEIRLADDKIVIKGSGFGWVPPQEDGYLFVMGNKDSINNVQSPMWKNIESKHWIDNWIGTGGKTKKRCRRGKRRNKRTGRCKSKNYSK